MSTVAWQAARPQGALDLRPRKAPVQWGGFRPGAGRPRGLVHDPSHETRPAHKPYHPSHITLRVVPEVGRLRRRYLWRAFRRALVKLGASATFRVPHVSIQSNHVHLLVEGGSAMDIARGVQRFAILAAKALNRALRRRGKVFAHRYHRVDITSPRQMRHELSYVLNNWRRHREDVTTVGARDVAIDPYSTAWAFDGWRDLTDMPAWERLPAADPTTWLLRVGWRRHGEIAVREIPGPRRSAR